MQSCEKFEDHAIDYVYNLLSEPEVDTFEKHLKHCATCTEAVRVVKAVLDLTEETEFELDVPALALRDIEKNVYKRLAASSSTDKRTFQAHLRHLAQILLEWPQRPLARWQRTVTASAVAIVLIAITVFFTKPFEQQPALRVSSVESADARIKQYEQEYIQRSLEDALITGHLRNDAWEAAGRFQRVKEQAQGTHFAKVANTHLQRLR